ncbi:type II secretion system F family protein [Planctomycetota bacterium]
MLITLGIAILFIYGILGYKKPAIALITIPIVCLLYGYGAVWSYEPQNILFAPVIFLVTLVSAALSRKGDEPVRWPRILAIWILSILVLLLILGAMTAAFRFAGIYIWAYFILFIGSIVSFGLVSRHATAAYVISTIGSSMRQNLPLPMALESAAAGQMDKRARILRRIKNWLVQGYSLSEAIKRGYPKCPGYAVAAISSAEKINQLPLAIEAIEADMAAKADESRKLRPIHPFYPIILISFMFFTILLLMKYVIPLYKAVISEMFEEAKLPIATRILMRISEFVAYQYGWVIGLVLLVLLLVIIPFGIYIRVRPRRPEKPYLISRIGDFIKWHIPVLHWFERNYSMVHTVELLRLSFNAGCTVNEAIANTLNLDVNYYFRKRLARWLEKVERGDNIAAAAAKSRLGGSLAWAFDEKVNQGNTLSILEMLENFFRSNYNFRVNLARFIIAPCIVIAMGLMVGFVVYAIFSPGVLIIHHLADQVIP